jgi:hypothetical protein
MLKIDKEFHDYFIENTNVYWRLKLSAVLIFHTVYAVIKEDDIRILIDTNFDAGNQKYVTKCLNKLFDRHKIYDELVYPRIEYRSDHDYYINTVDLKTKS